MYEENCGIGLDVQMHAWLDAGTRSVISTVQAPTAGGYNKRLCIITPGSRAAAEGAAARAAARSGKRLKWGQPYRERLHVWNHCVVCGTHCTSLASEVFLKCSLVYSRCPGSASGDGDGVVVCETCQGQGIVATKVRAELPSTFHACSCSSHRRLS